MNLFTQRDVFSSLFILSQNYLIREASCAIIRDSILESLNPIRYFWSTQLQNQDITNAIKVRVLQNPKSKSVRRTNILVIYIRAHLSLPRPGSPGLSYNINKGSFRPGVPRNRGGREEGLARAMLAMSGKGGML